MKKILKIGLWIVVSMFAIIVIIYLLLFSNQRYIFPEEIGKVDLNYEVHRNVFINCFPAEALETLDHIEQEQGYIDIEEIEQLREIIEGIDCEYIIFSYRRPLRYIRYYDGSKPILGDLSDGYGSFGCYGDDKGNVLYFYRVRQKINWPYDGNI